MLIISGERAIRNLHQGSEAVMAAEKCVKYEHSGYHKRMLRSVEIHGSFYKGGIAP